MKQNVLIGQVVTAIHIADDREAIKFTLADGRDIVARCDADCCSHTWIEDVLDPAAVLGSEVTGAVALNLPEELRRPTTTGNYEEEMAYYGFAIETAKGRCTIAYRNSSNGYYGGSLSWPDDDYFYGGVNGQNISEEVWRPLVALPPAPVAVDPQAGASAARPRATDPDLSLATPAQREPQP